MAEMLKKAIEVQPTNKDFYLFLGLAYHRMGSFVSAYENFCQAKKYVSIEELNLLESAEPLLTPKKGKHYARLSSNEKNQFAQTFWKQRDPLFMTEFNERKLEHYCRFAYEYSGNATTERMHSSVQLADANPGGYSLIIRITDINTGRSVEKEVTFKIVN